MYVLYLFHTDFIVLIGHYCPTKRIAVRVLAGAWCGTCFFLVQIYCCTLISHLTASNEKTIINSFFDIPKVPGVTFTVDRALALDAMLQVIDLIYNYNSFTVLSNALIDVD